MPTCATALSQLSGKAMALQLMSSDHYMARAHVTTMVHTLAQRDTPHTGKAVESQSHRRVAIA